MTEATTKPSKPTLAEVARRGLCPNCGKHSAPRRSSRGPAPLYCSRECKRELTNRNLTDGLALVTMVKAWRATRGSGEVGAAAFRRICETADMLNEEDRTAGRPRADYHAAVILNTQVHSVADQRYGRRKVAEAKRRQNEAEA